MFVSTMYGNRESSAVAGWVSVVSPAGKGRRPQFQYERCRAVGQAHSACLAARVSGGLKSHSARGHGPISESGGNASLAEAGERYGEV